MSTAIILLGVILTLAAGEAALEVFSAIQGWITTNFGWFYILVMNLVLVFCIALIFTKYAGMRLGGEDAEPEFSIIGWFAMLFSAGMGIGLLFFGVAEPMYHYLDNPLGESESIEAARMSMELTFLHWGFHPWAIYAVVGLGIGFFGFSEKLPLSIRNIFYPVLGRRIYGPIGNFIDILATIATLFGVATSLGLGVQQINAGISHLTGIPENTLVQTLLIAGITAIALWSVIRGLDAGIKFLSQVNIALAGILMLFVLILGPTLFIVTGLLENIGNYLQNLPSMSLWAETYDDGGWQSAWTLFYWAWWIAWSPFVGMFIARVSYGRTIRQYLTGVLLVPVAVTFVWLTVFGNSAIYMEHFGEVGIADAVLANMPVSLFVFLEQFPLGMLASILAVLVVVTFFVTSSDSGSMVIDIINAGGNPDPPKIQRTYWVILEGVIAAVLLMGGGLVALQTASLITGLPFAIIIFIMCWSLFKGLRRHWNKYYED
ncbi:BCCT family transporter [Desulfonatronospira sp.]|uniref:BCCT family transporter n=1 Tax=Desulfonatronospira sp. TaxID=1962951 RepID=UPI0025BB5D31|nr:BCCT family transporter [Desulfonatronospira sp.]